MTRSIYLGIAVMAVLTILQSTLFARFELLEVALQPALLFAIAWALLRGPYEGLVWAFTAGILLDMFSISPTGATALALMPTILLVVHLQQILPENPYLFPVLLSGFAIAVHFLLYSIILSVAQFGFNSAFLETLPTIAILHALLMIPIYWMLHYVDRVLYPRRIEV